MLATLLSFIYRGEYPPIEPGQNWTTVFVDIDIFSIGSFEEIAMTYDVKFTIKLEWFDGRLTFTNLKVKTIDMYK